MTEDNITALAGGIAHDLNTILTTVFGYCEIALETIDESSEAGQNIRRIIVAAVKARELTDQLLNLARQRETSKPVIRLRDILRDTVEFIKPSLPAGIRVVLRMPSQDLSVSAGPVQLFRVFMNLSVNAVQAMGKKGGRLTITLDEEVKTGDDVSSARCALVRFADTGKGMDSKTAARMFEPFFTAGKEGKGTGLGLSVVYDIIRGLNGDLKVVSKPGKGTVIDVLIPIAEKA